MKDGVGSATETPPARHVNLSEPELVEAAVLRDEGVLARSGALVAYTGEHTGRSPKDRFIVAHGETKDRVDWGGFNQQVDPAAFDALWDKAEKHMESRDVFVIDGFVGADPAHTLKVRVRTEFAWHALFCRQLFRRPTPEELPDFEPDFTLFSAATLEADPEVDGTRTSTFVGLDLERRKVLIVGSRYAGEMKKSIFSAANVLFPMDGVLTMHCSANVDDGGRVALFFGLSGTGKTTLSADEGRYLIGDDEHGWSDNGVFNLEGGCYAKCIDLSQEKEPQIFHAIRFGSILENVVLDERRTEQYEDGSLTENTRAVYPVEFIPGFVEDGRAGHASAVVFLTADAFGALPPVSILSKDAAIYHFLSGFTSKLAGTEVGLGTEPEATFSTCFGAPFLPLAPSAYAEMLADKIDRHSPEVFLINTGWTGGPYGVGHRIDLGVTRQIVRAATTGALHGVETWRHPIFNLDVPKTCSGISDHLLDPSASWPDKEAYESQARELAQSFRKNFARFTGTVSSDVERAGPVDL
ncbi:MAG: phosphoenolpyruvate carboxykinase (ATP) [Actinobacteria bacterium]|nr:phosphoenolpyruvate carboxykinase (ATP) [Actinomycetota bacterium]